MDGLLQTSISKSPKLNYLGYSLFAGDTLFYIFVGMAITVQEAIDTVFLDTPHYDVTLKFYEGYQALNKLAIHNASDLMPYTIVDGKLKTQEFTIEAYVTAAQNTLLMALYQSTVLPGYVDQRYPISVSWGSPGDNNQVSCYLANYTPPVSVDFKSGSDILSVTLVLRAI